MAHGHGVVASLVIFQGSSSPSSTSSTFPRYRNRPTGGGFANGVAGIPSLTFQDIDAALLSLHATHSLLLHPHKVEPWVVDPFALYPASCWVQVGDRGYWATCLYCAFGIAAALKVDADIFTRFGGESEQCHIRVRDQDIVEKDLVFHLSTPIRNWWDNVIHSCASFQPFRHEDEVSIISYFETDVHDIDPNLLQHAIAVSYGDSLYVSTAVSYLS